MARKAVLQGGKRDEIINVATKQFFEKGYEETSIRSILNDVGGEVGMFYHYFKSKDELFQVVVERFFHQYQEHFYKIVEMCTDKEEFVEKMLKFYLDSMKQFGHVSDNLHWTIMYSLSVRTIKSLLPAIEEIIKKVGYHIDRPIDIATSQFLYSLSATLHSESFAGMSFEDQKKELLALGDRLFPG